MSAGMGSTTPSTDQAAPDPATTATPLLDWYPTAPGHALRDTSIEAAAAIASRAETLRAAVLAMLKAAPLSVHQCAAALGEPVASVQPRFSELVALDLVVDSGTRTRNLSGRSAIVWRTPTTPLSTAPAADTSVSQPGEQTT